MSLFCLVFSPFLCVPHSIWFSVCVSCYYEFCDTILVQWLMFDINPHPFLGADECIGDYMVWLIPYMFLLKVPEHDMTISDLQIAPQFFGFVFGPYVFRVEFPPD